MGQPITTNPWLIALINMSVVFGVLGALGLVIGAIRMIDPTQKKTAKVESKVEAPATAPVAAVAVQSNDDVIAVIAAAIASYGYSFSQIACIRRVSGGEGWAQAARVEAVTVRNQMF